MDPFSEPLAKIPGSLPFNLGFVSSQIEYLAKSTWISDP